MKKGPGPFFQDRRRGVATRIFTKRGRRPLFSYPSNSFAPAPRAGTIHRRLRSRLRRRSGRDDAGRRTDEGATWELRQPVRAQKRAPLDAPKRSSEALALGWAEGNLFNRSMVPRHRRACKRFFRENGVQQDNAREDGEAHPRPACRTSRRAGIERSPRPSKGEPR